ncbi:hypothetical protein [Paraburkholderia phenoliruptrix]|uniref:hypothetical protein n=1 Tax=Paraburkholderia phenoliruptrix TaxID=252970 RepID=UPI00320A29CD
MRRELREAQKLREQLRPDLDYLKRRFAGENADALLEQSSRAPARNSKACNSRSTVKPGKSRAKDLTGSRSALDGFYSLFGIATRDGIFAAWQTQID